MAATTTRGPEVQPGTMLPAESLLVDTLPTETLSPSGRPVGPLRDDLYKIHNVRNAFNVLVLYLQSFGVIIAALWIGQWWAYIIAFFLMGRAFALFGILGHEAAHRLLFSNRKINDFVGVWIVGAPGFLPTDIYRRGHMAHHKDEFGPNEPDLALYSGYPTTRSSWRRKLTRDATLNSGWKNLKPLLLAAKAKQPAALRIVGAQIVIFLAFTIAGYPLVYPLLWLLPWMTMWRVLNRLRSIAEHGGLQRSDDRRLTTHHIKQHWIAKFWFVPYNTGYHLAHHVDIGVPFQNLPRLHRELVESGWVVPELEYRSYIDFWRRVSSAPEG